MDYDSVRTRERERLAGLHYDSPTKQAKDGPSPERLPQADAPRRGWVSLGNGCRAKTVADT